MKKKSFLTAMVLFLCFTGNALAGMSLSTKLHKPFKELAYPHAEKIVGIEIDTKVDFLEGNKKSDDLDRAGKIHEMLIRVYNKAGWKEDELATDDVTSKNVEIVIGEGMTLKFEETLRLQAFINQCPDPFQKYRGGDIRSFFADKVVGESEYCVTYDNQLEYDEQKAKK